MVANGFIGRFQMAAKQAKDIAQLCESESNYEQAIHYFQMAADYYEGEGSTRFFFVFQPSSKFSYISVLQIIVFCP